MSKITINYIEFSVRNIERSKIFYGDVFGWDFTDFGPDYCEFSDGQMKGGFEKSEDVHTGGPLVVLYSQNLEDMQEKIVAAGGEISKSLFSFPGGERFQFLDLDGYELAIWREKE